MTNENTTLCVFILGRSELAEAALGNLKEQYPVTAHAPNFDFWTGCREIKRCEENLEKSVCKALGRVRYCTKTSQD